MSRTDIILPRSKLLQATELGARFNKALPDRHAHTGFPPVAFLFPASMEIAVSSRHRGCPRFFGGSSQRGLTFSWSQSLRWVYSSPLTTQAIWPQNLAGCCAALELSSSLLTWSQTPYFLLSTPSSATRTDTTASIYPQVATSIDLKHLLTWSQLQVNPVLRNSAGGPNHVFP